MGNSNQSDQRSSNITLQNDQNNESKNTDKSKIQLSQDELRKRLTPIQYSVTQEKATEKFVNKGKWIFSLTIFFRPYTGEYNDHKENGDYLCVVCEQDLFNSDGKFESHCGWPAFSKPTSSDVVDCRDDFSLSMTKLL